MFLEVLQNRVGLMFIKREITVFVCSMCTIKRVVLGTPEIISLCTAAILDINLIINIKLRLVCFFASAILNWLVTYLFDSFGRPHILYELKHLA